MLPTGSVKPFAHYESKASSITLSPGFLPPLTPLTGTITRHKILNEQHATGTRSAASCERSTTTTTTKFGPVFETQLASWEISRFLIEVECSAKSWWKKW